MYLVPQWLGSFSADFDSKNNYLEYKIHRRNNSAALQFITSSRDGANAQIPSQANLDTWDLKLTPV